MEHSHNLYRRRISLRHTKIEFVKASREWDEAGYSIRQMPAEDSVELPCGLKEHVLAISHSSTFVKAKIDDRYFEQVVPANRVAFLPAGASNSAEFIGKGRFRVVEHIAIRKKLFSGFAESFDLDLGSLDPLFNESHKPLQACFAIFRNAISEKSEPSQLLVDTILQNIATQVLLAASSRRDQIFGELSRRFPCENIGRVRKALEFLEANVSNNPSLADLANSQGLSAFHFSRLFRSATGYSPHQYQLALRIERAKQLLEGNEPLAIVATNCGFADQAHMTRQFRAFLGTTPGSYRANFN